MILTFFLCASWPLICLLWRNTYLDLPPIFWFGFFFFLILSCMSCSCILEMYHFFFATIFSHSEGCLFVLFMVSFAVQKLLSFIKSHLFSFISIILGGGSKKILLWFWVHFSVTERDWVTWLRTHQGFVAEPGTDLWFPDSLEPFAITCSASSALSMCMGVLHRPTGLKRWLGYKII